jgi:hypothetical protein
VLLQPGRPGQSNLVHYDRAFVRAFFERFYKFLAIEAVNASTLRTGYRGMDEIDNHLLALRAGDPAPLRAYLIEHVIEKWLAAPWVQRDLRSHHRDEYVSELYSDLKTVLDRLAKNDVTADKVLKYTRQELSHSRKHMYAYRQKGNKGRERAYMTLRRHRSDKPITGRDDEDVRSPNFIDDPTITDRHPMSDPSRYPDSQSAVAARDWESLTCDIEELSPYVWCNIERELWMKLWLWTTRVKRAEIPYVHAANLIQKLKDRRDKMLLAREVAA